MDAIKTLEDAIERSNKAAAAHVAALEVYHAAKQRRNEAFVQRANEGNTPEANAAVKQAEAGVIAAYNALQKAGREAEKAYAAEGRARAEAR